MARKPRLHVSGCPQHIIQRGNNRSACFYADADYAFYLKKLKDAALQHQVKIHAFVLMTNHVHLLATGKEQSSITDMMQAMGTSFVRYMNITYQRTGTLWEGRYKSSLVSTREYFLTLSQYIELNPVRAGMVATPGAYPWSSYRHNAMGIPIGLISEHDEYTNLGGTKAARIQGYRNLFPEHLPKEVLDEIRTCTNKGWVIGNDKFKQEMELALGRKTHGMLQGGDRKSKAFKDQRT
ncbi:MAG: transposase [Gammaproteobacteria bacterium RIFCSPLOWO2_02_FULL_57_10]|nr:MAG: transposase [Gammaproteobacteria bacterium RIFCSPLOWO2_02_FULL_57_10]